MSKLCFEEKQFCWKTYKFVHLFGLRAEENFHLSRRLRGRSVQMALTVSWGELEEKQFFRRTHQIFDRFSKLWEKKLGVWLNFTRRVAKTAFFESRKNFGENFLLEKLQFDSSLSSSQPKKNDFSKTSSGGLSELHSLCQRNTSRKNQIAEKWICSIHFFRNSTGEKIRV